MKVHNNEVWEDVKGGRYLGFSIEGIFDEKIDTKKDKYEEAWKKIQEILED